MEKVVDFLKKNWFIVLSVYLLGMFITGMMNLYHGYFGYGMILTFGSLTAEVVLLLDKGF